MSRFVKLIKTARPTAEYEELMKYMTDNLRNIRRNIRPGANFPYFHEVKPNERGVDLALVKTTAPSIWIHEFLQLDQTVKYQLLTDIHASNFVKVYYKERCQHEEKNNFCCESCNKANSCYRKSIIKHKIIDLQDTVKKAHEWYGKNVIIIKDGEFFNSNDDNVEDLGPEDIAVINWNKPEE